MGFPLNMPVNQPRARRSDPSTSHHAAAMSARFANSHGNRIVEALKVHGRMSPVGIGGMAGLTVVQVDRRLVELQRAGRVQVVKDETGNPVVWSGCRVWEAV
jgi:Transcriptional regulators